MGNTLGLPTIQVNEDETKEIQQKQTQYLKKQLEMKNLCEDSSHHIQNVISIPFLFKVDSTSFFAISQENGVYLVAIYNVLKHSVMIIHFHNSLKEFVGVHSVHHNPISDDFLIIEEKSREIQHFNSKELDGFEIDDRFSCQMVKTISSNFTSISYFKAVYNKTILYYQRPLGFLKQEGSQLFIRVGNQIQQFNFEKKEIVEIFENSLKYSSKNGSYLCEKYIGFQKLIDKVNNPEIPNFMCMSNDEIYFVTFDFRKSLGEVYFVHNYRFDETNEPFLTFSLLGIANQMFFSEDSEFLFILEFIQKDYFLVIFSLREKKFVFRRFFKDPKIDRIHLIKNFVLCSTYKKKVAYFLAEVLEIKIPNRLKPYSIHFPANMFFIFK
jgi:hypothetical protein